MGSLAKAFFASWRANLISFILKHEASPSSGSAFSSIEIAFLKSLIEKFISNENYKNKIIGKPSSYQDAFEVLSLLSGKSHYVISALSLTYNENQITIYDSTRVSFKTLRKEEIKNYINNFDVLDKAGSYNIEDAEEYFIKNIDGCYNNIVGFPEEKFLGSEIKQILDSKWFFTTNIKSSESKITSIWKIFQKEPKLIWNIY